MRKLILWVLGISVLLSTFMLALGILVKFSATSPFLLVNLILGTAHFFVSILLAILVTFWLIPPISDYFFEDANEKEVNKEDKDTV